MSDGKLCNRCQTVKPRCEFHKDRAKRDGLNPLCKVCTRKYRQAYYHTQGAPLLKVNQARYQKSQKGQARSQRDRARKKASGAIRAYSVMRWAIQIGKLPRIRERVCLVCGEQAQCYYHPGGYSRPLDVAPYCQRHLPRPRKRE